MSRALDLTTLSSLNSITDGMSAYLVVHDCGNYTLTQQLNNKVRNVYLAAEVEEWNYAPSGLNKYDKTPLTTSGR